jgi:hypothetical protein
VRGGVVVLAGENGEECGVATVEVLRYDSEAEKHTLVDLPPLSCGPRFWPTALPVDESESAEGQVLLLGGFSEDARVVKVDLATGACTPQPPLLYDRVCFAAARMSDGRVVCAGGGGVASRTAEVLEPPVQGCPDGVWRELPHMSVQRWRPAGCVLSDGRVAVFGGKDNNDVRMASCEALTLDGKESWEPLPPMLETRRGPTCAAVGGCVIVADGFGSSAAVEVYEEALGRWRRLPCSLPHEGAFLSWMEGVLM